MCEYGALPCDLSSLTLAAVLLSPSLVVLARLSSTLNSFLTNMPLGLRPRTIILLSLPCIVAPVSFVTNSSSLSRSGFMMVSSASRLRLETAADTCGLSLRHVRWYPAGFIDPFRERPKIGPNSLTNGPRSIGRQAQTIPAFASITDHIVAGIGPQVGSGSLADAAMVVAR